MVLVCEKIVKKKKSFPVNKNKHDTLAAHCVLFYVDKACILQ